ncbi:MAG TPA: hypothetical protein VFO73_09315 [Candidatus Limnocylindrales bacterium]|nr:hypothetical protein [Candidatus Limnocylindrales bacterium]
MESIIITVVELLTAPIPWLVSSGVLLVVFGGLWLAIAVALVRDPARIDAAWRRIRDLPLLLQAFAWLLFLPVMAGMWAWRTTWPPLARLVVVGGIAGWNLLVFLPRPA